MNSNKMAKQNRRSTIKREDLQEFPEKKMWEQNNQTFQDKRQNELYDYLSKFFSNQNIL